MDIISGKLRTRDPKNYLLVSLVQEKVLDIQAIHAYVFLTSENIIPLYFQCIQMYLLSKSKGSCYDVCSDNDGGSLPVVTQRSGQAETEAISSLQLRSLIHSFGVLSNVTTAAWRNGRLDGGRVSNVWLSDFFP